MPVPDVKIAPLRIDASIARCTLPRILFTEDNSVNQRLALSLLEQMGYRADEAGPKGKIAGSDVAVDRAARAVHESAAARPHVEGLPTGA